MQRLLLLLNRYIDCMEKLMKISHWKGSTRVNMQRLPEYDATVIICATFKIYVTSIFIAPNCYILAI